MSYPKKDKTLFKSSLLIFSTKLLNACATIFIMAFFSHKLSKEDFGIYQSFWVQMAIPAAIAGLGLSLMIYTYSPQKLLSFGSAVKKRHYAAFAMFLAVVAIIFSLLRCSDSALFFSKGYLMVVVFLLFVLINIVEPILFVAKKSTSLLIANVSYALLFIGVSLWEFGHGYNFYHLLLLVIPVFIFKAGILFQGLYSFVNDKNIERQAISISEFKQAKTLWLHLGIYDLSSNLILWIDKVVISIVFSAEIAANYFNGTVNIPFIGLALSAVGSATLLQLGKSNIKEKKRLLLIESGKMLSCIAFPIFALLFFYGSEVVNIVFSSKYQEAVPIFLCSILVLPVRAFSSTIILQNAHKGSIINAGVVIDFLVALVLVIPLYKLAGLAGVALSFVISTYCQFFYYLYNSAKVLEQPIWAIIPLKNWALKLMMLCVLSWSVYHVTSSLSALARLLVGVALMGITSLLLLKWEMRQSATSES